MTLLIHKLPRLNKPEECKFTTHQSGDKCWAAFYRNRSCLDPGDGMHDSHNPEHPKEARKRDWEHASMAHYRTS